MNGLQAQALVTVALIAVGSIFGAQAQTLTVTDGDILNFALQSECLAASFWYAAATGETLTAAQLGELSYQYLCSSHEKQDMHSTGTCDKDMTQSRPLQLLLRPVFI